MLTKSINIRHNFEVAVLHDVLFSNPNIALFLANATSVILQAIEHAFKNYFQSASDSRFTCN